MVKTIEEAQDSYMSRVLELYNYLGIDTSREESLGELANQYSEEIKQMEKEISISSVIYLNR